MRGPRRCCGPTFREHTEQVPPHVELSEGLQAADVSGQGAELVTAHILQGWRWGGETKNRIVVTMATSGKYHSNRVGVAMATVGEIAWRSVSALPSMATIQKGITEHNHINSI